MINYFLKGFLLSLVIVLSLIPSLLNAKVTELDNAATLIIGTTKPMAVCGVLSAAKAASCPDNAFSISDQFLLAVAKNNKTLAQRLIQQGVNINYRSQNRLVVSRVNIRADKVNQFLVGSQRYQFASGTAYDIALSQGNAGMVLWLLQRGANPAAGYFKNKIENNFEGSYPPSYLGLSYQQRGRIVSVGEVLTMAVKENDVKKARKLLTIEPRAIHYLGNSLLPDTLRLGKWQMAKLFLNRGKDVEKLVNFPSMLYMPLRSEPTNYVILESLLRHAKKRKNMNFQDFLSRSIVKKDAKALRLLVNYGANLNPKDQKAPLFIAAEKNDVNTVKFLLKLGANPNIQYAGTSLLHRAIGNEQSVLATALINGGANVNAIDTYKRTPIHIAIHKKDPRLTRLLIKSKASIHRVDQSKDTLLHIAVREDKPALAGLLLKSGARVNLKNDSKETPLQIAVRDSKLVMARMLVKAGAHVNLKDDRGRTPLQIAMNKKNLAYTQLLIAAGANVNFRDSGENTPLIKAVKQVNLPLIKLLLKSGAKVNHANRFQKYTALHYATEKVDLNMMRLLLAAGSDVNIKNANKETPLHMAIVSKNLRMVNALMQRKPVLNTLNASGQTSLHLAVIQKNLPITNRLLQAGATPNTVDRNGNTPLFDALYGRKVQIANALIMHGANLNVANDYRQAPLDIALSKGLRGVARRMVNKGAQTAAELGSAGSLRVKMVK